MACKLTPLQRRIMALLEEAGEEEFCTLINTAAKPRGSYTEILDMQEAIAALMLSGLVSIAVDRDSVALDLIPLPYGEGKSVLSGVERLIQWSSDKDRWAWYSQGARIEVVVTDLGQIVARSILKEEGYPSKKLENYRDGDDYGDVDVARSH